MVSGVPVTMHSGNDFMSDGICAIAPLRNSGWSNSKGGVDNKNTSDCCSQELFVALKNGNIGTVDLRVSTVKLVQEWRLTDRLQQPFTLMGSSSKNGSVTNNNKAGMNRRCYALMHLPSTHSVASGDSNGTISILDRRTGCPLHRWTAHDSPVVRLGTFFERSPCSHDSDITDTGKSLQFHTSYAASYILSKYFAQAAGMVTNLFQLV